MGENELLHAVLSRPDEDAPRLAYADFMDAAGSPRGKFIRIQVATARMGKGMARPEQFHLRSEAQQLRQQFGAAWAGPVGEMVRNYSYNRGFVEAVTMPAADFLKRAPQLFGSAPIQHLDLTGARGVLEDLSAYGYLLYARSLSLNQCGLTDDDIQMLATSPNVRNLRWLSLYMNNVGAAGAEALAASKNLPLLAYVNLRGNPVDPCRQFQFDQDVLVDSWLPEDGKKLEEKFGPIRWLNPPVETGDDLPPDRFRLARL